MNAAGYYTGWLQTSPTLGIVLSLAVIVGTPAPWSRGLRRLGMALAVPALARPGRGSRSISGSGCSETPVFQAVKARADRAQSLARGV